jgi:hypothetical protein
VQDLVDLEGEGWRALSTSQEEARAFYGRVLADEALMVFPGGMLLRGKDEILASIGAQPWASFSMEETQALPLGDEAGAVVYHVRAQREGREPYAALISSVYVRCDGQWRLVLHQQTPG